MRPAVLAPAASLLLLCAAESASGAPPLWVPIWGADHFSYGAAVMRGVRAGEGCATSDLVIATGHDHTFDYLPRLALDERCLPEAEPSGWAYDPLHYSAVATADFCGDGTDEVVFTSLADRTSALLTGQVRVATVGDATTLDDEVFPQDGGFQCTDAPTCWREYRVDDGLSALSVAVADVNVDGFLDLVVGTAATEPPADPPVRAGAHDAPKADDDGPPDAYGFPFAAGGPTSNLAPVHDAAGDRHRDVRKLRGQELVGPTLVYFGSVAPTPSGCHLTFAQPAALEDAQGVVAVRVHDVDADGRPDLLLAGRHPYLVHGSGGRTFGPVKVLKAEGTTPAHHWLDLDVVTIDSTTYVSASRGCFSTTECAHLLSARVPMGVARWTVDARHARALPFTAVDGVPGTVRLGEVDGEPGPDMLVGMMLTRTEDSDCGTRPWWTVNGITVCPGGTPQSGPPTASDAVPWRALPLGEAPPMIIRADPMAFRPTRTSCVDTVLPFAVYDGPGVPARASFHAEPCLSPDTAPGTPLPTHFGPGQRFASVAFDAAGAGGVASIVWEVEDSPPLVLSNAYRSPADPNLVLNPYDEVNDVE